MYSQVSNLFLPKLPCTRFQSVIEISLVSCVCRFSLCLLFQCLKMFHRVHLHAKGGCVTQCQPEDTHREFQTQQQKWIITPKSSLSRKREKVNWSHHKRSCKGTDGSGNGSGHRQVYIPRGYFNPSLSPSTKLRLSSADRQRKTEFLTVIPNMTITTIYANKYVDI